MRHRRSGYAYISLMISTCPMTLLRQHFGYWHWYDRAGMAIKDVDGVDYVTCMNPTAGSFTINSRLQRHFSTSAFGIPSDGSVKFILSQMLEGHFEHFGFPPSIRGISRKLLNHWKRDDTSVHYTGDPSLRGSID
jgi:dynein heavy chain